MERIYINNFCEELNYQNIILYIGNVSVENLRNVLEKHYVNKLWRLVYSINDPEPARKNFIYIENCDLQELTYPIYEYIEEGYDVCILHEDKLGKFYVQKKL